MHIKGRFLLLALVFIPISILVVIAALHAGDWEDDIPVGVLVVQTGSPPDNEAFVAMQGIIYQIDNRLLLSHLSHDHAANKSQITATHLVDVARHWPQGTVFANMLSAYPDAPTTVLRTATGHFIVSTDSDLLDLVAQELGDTARRQVNPQRLELSFQSDNPLHEQSITLYAAALLASHQIAFSKIGDIIAQ